MPALGHNGYLVAVKESSWGTDPASGYTAQAIQSESLKTTQAYLFPTPVRASREGSNLKVKAGITAGGSINFDADVEGILGLCLKSILSTEATTDNGSGNGGIHTFTPGASVPSLAFILSRDTLAAAANVWSYTGGVVDKLSLSAAEGDVLKAVATVSAKNGTPSATGVTPSYTTENPLVYHSGSFTVGGSAVAIKSFKLDIASGNYSKRGKIGSATIQQQQPGSMQVTGEIEAYFDDMTLVTDYLNGVDAAIVLTLTGSAVGTATRGLVITIPVTQFTGETPSIPGATSEIMLKLPFTAWQSGSGSPDHIVQAALTNSKRTAY